MVAALMTGGCRDTAAPRSDAALDDALRRDLQLASATGVALANPERDAPRARFLSAIEGGPKTPKPEVTVRDPRGTVRHAAPAARRRPRRDVAPSTATVGNATTDERAVAEAPAASAPAEPIVAAPTPVPQASTPANTPTVLVSGPNTSDAPVGSGDGNGRGGRGGGVGVLGGIGGIIGVVIRGGGVGDVDHCERDRPGSRGRRGGIGAWPGRVAGPGTSLPMPTGRPTFPRW